MAVWTWGTKEKLPILKAWKKKIFTFTGNRKTAVQSVVDKRNVNMTFCDVILEMPHVQGSRMNVGWYLIYQTVRRHLPADRHNDIVTLYRQPQKKCGNVTPYTQSLERSPSTHTLYYSKTKSYKFRLHKAAIIRPCVSDKYGRNM
jgi:hypothetical protein